MQVLLKNGEFAHHDGIVKHVQPDGRGSLRLAVYIPRLLRTLDVDIFNVEELQ